MTDVLVGAGGWSYFQVPDNNSLRAYAQAFKFVEVNRSYYRLPTQSLLRKWRQTVPSSFVFSLRYPRQFTDQYALKLEGNALRLARAVQDACTCMRAPIVTILVSNQCKLTGVELEYRLDQFLQEFYPDNTRIAIEFRGLKPSSEVLNVIRDNGAVHSVDISKEEPEVGSSILYSRLFGKGEKNIYEFDNAELKEIAEKASRTKFEKSILAFHGVRMYRDAARMKIYLDKGYFPRITNNTGLEAVEEVLAEDTHFPISKAELVRRQGWKLFNQTVSETRRMREILETLPEEQYLSLNEVLVSLRKTTPIL